MQVDYVNWSKVHTPHLPWFKNLVLSCLGKTYISGKFLGSQCSGKSLTVRAKFSRFQYDVVLCFFGQRGEHHMNFFLCR